MASQPLAKPKPKAPEVGHTNMRECASLSTAVEGEGRGR